MKKTIMKFLGFAALMAFAATGVHGAEQTLWVDDDWAGTTAGATIEGYGVFGTTAFDTIQKAVEAADVSEGPVTIKVKAGTYNEVVSFRKYVWPDGRLPHANLKFNDGTQDWYGRLNFVGEEGAVISGQITTEEGVSFNVADVSVEGFTFVGSTYPIYIDNSTCNSKNITIKNNTFNYNGAGPYVISAVVDGLTVTGNKFNQTAGNKATLGGAECSINNVTIADNVFANWFGIYGQVLEGGVVVSGNTFTASSNGYCIWINDNKAENLGKITITGNNFANTITYPVGFENTYGKKSDITIGTGNTYGDAAITGWAEVADNEVLISSSAEESLAQYYNHKLYLGDETAFKTPTAAVAGRTEPVTILNYNQQMEAPEDWKFVTDENGTRLVKKEYVAKIGTKGYETFENACAAATAGETITLVAETVTCGEVTLDKAITIDLNQKKLAPTVGLWVKAAIAITNGVVDVSNAEGSMFKWNAPQMTAVFVYNNSSLRMENVDFVGQNTAAFVPIFVGRCATFDAVDCEFSLDHVNNGIYVSQGSVSTIRNSKLTFTNVSTASNGEWNRVIDCADGYKSTFGPATLDFYDSELNIDGARDAIVNVNVSFDNTKVDLRNLKKSGHGIYGGGAINLTNGSEVFITNAVGYGVWGAISCDSGCKFICQSAYGFYLEDSAGQGLETTFKAGSLLDANGYVGAYCDFTVEKGADVTVSGDLEAGAAVSIADGKYNTLSCDGGAFDLTGGIYKVEPDAAFVNSGYRVEDNVDDATKDDYPWTIGQKPVAMIGEQEFKTYAEALAAATSDETKIVDLMHNDLAGNHLEVYEEQATGNVYLWGSAGANRVFWLTGVSQGSDSNGANATFSGSRAEGNVTLASVMSAIQMGDVICLPAGYYYVGSVVSISRSCTLTGWVGGEGTTLHKSSGHSQKNQHLLNCNFRAAADLTEAGMVDLVGLKLTTTKDHICDNIACWRCAAVQAIGHVTVNVYDVEIRNFPMAAFSVNAANSIANSWAITGKNATLNWHGLKTYDNFCTASIFALPRSDQGNVAAAAFTQAIFNYDENCAFADADPDHPFHLEDPPKRVPGLGNCIVNGYSLLEYQNGTDGTVTGGFYAADPTASGKLAPCYVANYKENYEFGGFVQNGWLVEQDTDACQAKIVHENGSATYYATFADAVADAAVGGTVTVNREIAAGETVEIANKNVTLDLVGQTIKAGITFAGAAAASIVDSVGGGKVSGQIVVGENATLAISAGTFDRPLNAAWLAEGLVARAEDLDNGPWTVGVPVTDVKPVADEVVTVDEETVAKLTEEQQAQVPDAVEELKGKVEESFKNDPVVTATETHADKIVKENPSKMLEDVKAAATAQGQPLTDEEAAQVAANIAKFAEGKADTNTTEYLKIEVKTIAAKPVVVAATELEPEKVAAEADRLVYEVEPIFETVTVKTDAEGNVTVDKTIPTVMSNEEIKKNPVTFNLEVFNKKATTALVTHTSPDPNYLPESFTCPIWEKAGRRYITITTSHFSVFAISYTEAVYAETEATIGIFKIDQPAAGETAVGVPFTRSGVEDGAALTYGELVTTGAQTGDEAKVWTPGADDHGYYAAAAADDAAAAGGAFWYRRASASTIPLTVAGLVTNVLEATGAASATERPGMTLFANPLREAVDVLAKIVSTPVEGDQIVTEGGGARYVYEGGGWKQVVPGALLASKEGVSIRGETTTTAVTSVMVPAGKAFWYVTKTGVPSVQW